MGWEEDTAEWVGGYGEGDAGGVSGGCERGVWLLVALLGVVG